MNFLTRIGIVSHATGQVVSGGNNSTQNLLRFLAIIIGPILSLVSIHILMYVFWEDFFIIWIKSFALWFVIGSLIICAFLNFIGVLNGFWYHLTVWVLPLLCIILYFYKNPVKSDSNVNSSGHKTEIIVPDTTYIQLANRKYTGRPLSAYQRFEIVADPNTEFSVRGTGESGNELNEYIRFDSDGVCSWSFESQSKDTMFAPETKMVFKQTKGSGSPFIKVFY